jgi:hypothetical protein
MALLSVEGRRRLVQRCQSRPIAHVAAEMGISRQCSSKWINRHRKYGEAGLLDRPSVPQSSLSAAANAAAGPATPTRAPRSTATPAWPTPRPCPTSKPAPRSGSPTAPARSSPAAASPISTGSSPTTGPATAPMTSPPSYAEPTTSGSLHTPHATTARWSATTGSWPRNSSTPTLGSANSTSQKHCESERAPYPPSTPHRRPKASHPAPQRRHQRHGLIHLDVVFGTSRVNGSAGRHRANFSMAAGVTGVKKLTRLPSGSRNSSDRLPQGIVVGSVTKSVTKPVRFW